MMMPTRWWSFVVLQNHLLWTYLFVSVWHDGQILRYTSSGTFFVTAAAFVGVAVVPSCDSSESCRINRLERVVVPTVSVFTSSSSLFLTRRHPQPQPQEECILIENQEICLEENGYYQEETTTNANDTDDSFFHVDRIYVAPLESLRDSFESYESIGQREGSNMIKYQKRSSSYSSFPITTKRSENKNNDDQDTNSHTANLEYNHVIDGESEIVLVDTILSKSNPSVSETTTTTTSSSTTATRCVVRAFVRAGPRKLLHFRPETVHAAIVTCGGLCPGLNNVVRELVHALKYLYGVQGTVYGVTGGFHGFASNNTIKEGYEPVILTNELVENIHHVGGTVLRSSRGGFDIDAILDFIRTHQIQQLYLIGGDGTHRAAYVIHQACQKESLNVAVAGIPKTIDNDVDYIDRSFGFASAVEAAQNSIHAAKTEAMCNIPNGIGVVKLMGRSAGFLAAHAALGSGDVDVVLLPEVPIVLEGPNGILPFIRQRAKEQRYVVVVVAEGAGEELLGTSAERDASGNKKLPAIGEYVRNQVQAYFEKHGEEATVKYIDPSYTIRAVPANAADSLYCMELAQHAVHGAMAGYTGFSVGLVNNRLCYLPIPLLVATSPRSLNPYGQTWERILTMTGQPNTVPQIKMTKYSIPTTETEESVNQFPKLPDPPMH